MWTGNIHWRFAGAVAGRGGWRLARNAGETAGFRGWGMGIERSGLLAVAVAAVIAMPLAPHLASAQVAPQVPSQDHSQAQSQVPAPAQTTAPQPTQPGAPQADANCPGHPDALGTSRVLAIDPAQYPRIGHMQYPNSLPLNDKEVVLTFDDGPLPRYSNEILDILASQCVKVTYFMVGEMARAYPATVRRVYEEGHTIGTHSEDHPTRFGQMLTEKIRHEIDWGISDVGAALGSTRYLAPFFRIPALPAPTLSKANSPRAD